MLRSGGKIPRFDSLVKRVAGIGLRCLAGLWLFGQVVRLVTDFAWYRSLGYLPVWRGQVLLEAEIFAAFLAVAFMLGAPVFRAARHPAGQGNPVPRSGTVQFSGPLGRLEAWRRAIPRLLLWFTAAEAVLLAWNLAGHSEEWLLFGNAVQWGYAEPHTGWDASFFVFKLPLLTRWLAALWAYSLTLLTALAIGGGMRALPQVLTRRPVSPLGLYRGLRLLGAWLLLLRAMGYGLGACTLLAALDPDSHSWWLVRLSSLLGMGGCLALAALLLARKGDLAASRSGAVWRRGRAFAAHALPLLVVLVVPALLLRVLGPWAEMAGPADKRLEKAAVHAAWGPVETRSTPEARMGDAPWPAWDEGSLLQINPPTRYLDKTTVVWQGASLEWDGAWKMLLAGVPAASLLETDPRQVGDSNSQILVEGLPDRVGAPNAAGNSLAALAEVGSTRANTRRLDINQISVGSPAAVFGLPADLALVTRSVDNAVPSTGAPYQSLFWRLAWAWRLHDLYLAYGNSGANAILAFRSAEDRARRLVPFLTPCGPAHAVRVGGRILWSVDLATATSHFPGVPAIPSGALEGANAARHAVKMLIDAGTGEVTFYATTASQAVPDPLLRTWMRAIPGLIRPCDARPAGRAGEPYPMALLAARAWQEADGPSGVAFSPPYLLGGAGRTANGSAAVYTASWAADGEHGLWWLAADGDGRLQSVRGQGEVEAVRILLANYFARMFSRTDGTDEIKKEGRFGIGLGTRADPWGQTVLWPDSGAGGGWMVARSWFVSDTASGAGALRAVGAADLAARFTDSPQRVGVDKSLDDALAARDRSMGPVVAVAPGLGGAELVRRSLAANEAISGDFQHGNLGDIGRQLAAQRLWLRQYLQRQAPG